MKKVYVIQDVNTNYYLCAYGASIEFNVNIKDVMIYNSFEEAENELYDTWMENIFKGRTIEIKQYYI